MSPITNAIDDVVLLYCAVQPYYINRLIKINNGYVEEASMLFSRWW